MDEIWKPVIDYEGLYEVSNLGRVKSLERKVLNRTNPVPEKILKNGLTSNGYLKVSLYKNRIIKIVSVHRLVAEAFITNPENKHCIDHIDCNRTNNIVTNLRWATYSENNLRPYREGNKPTLFGKNSPTYKKLEYATS